MSENNSLQKKCIALIELDNKTQFESVFKYATEGILIVNKQGVIENVNPSIERLFGYTHVELEGKPIETLIPTRYTHNHTTYRNDYAHDPHSRPMGKNLDLWGMRKDGSEFPVEVSLSTFTTSDGDFTMAFIIDISERKKAEINEKNYRLELEKEVENRTLVLKEAINKLEKTKSDLDKSLHRERELNAMKTRFVSIASHEFRTPLSTILSSLSLVEKYVERNEPDKIDKHTDRIKKSIRGLTDILNDILSVNKLEEGKVFVNPEEFSLYTFLSETIAEVNGLLKKDQRVVLECQNEQNCRVVQDPKLLRHIVLNLLSNAVKFSEQGKEVRVFGELSADNFTVIVTDEGIGIPEKDQHQLFGRFFRAENAGQIQGTGLGLSIVAQYVKILNGEISYKSSEGVGSMFSVKLPRNLKK